MEALRPAVTRRPIPTSLQQEYSDLVEELHQSIPDFWEMVKSMKSSFESLDLFTRNLDMSYRDLKKARSLHMRFVSKWTWVSQRRKSRTTFTGLSPMQHLAAIHEISENLQQEIDRCLANCEQLYTHVISLCEWRLKFTTKKTQEFLFNVKFLSFIVGQIREKHALLPPHLSFLSQREAYFSDSDLNSNNSISDWDASDDEIGYHDEDDIKSIEDLTSSLKDTIEDIQSASHFMRWYLYGTSHHTTQITLKCEHLKANSSSYWSFCPQYLRCAFRKSKSNLNPEVRNKSESLSLKELLAETKYDFAQAFKKFMVLDEQAKRLIKLQGLQYFPVQELARTTLFIDNHLATLRQMKSLLNTLDDPNNQPDSVLLDFGKQCVEFLDKFCVW